MLDGFKNREILRCRSEKDFSLTSNEIFSIEEYGFIPIPDGEEFQREVWEINLSRPKRRCLIPLIESLLKADYYRSEDSVQFGPINIFVSMKIGLIKVVVFSDKTILAKCEDMNEIRNLGEVQGDWVRIQL